MLSSLLGRKFSNKCKHSVKCIKCRLETIRKKKQAMVRYLTKDVADLITGGHEAIAFGRMDALIVEINQSSCYDMIEQYCCCILEHLPTMQKERVCPEDTVEAVATLIFAAARFSDLPELAELRSEFTDRYGTHMEAYVNEEFVEKIQKKTFPQVKKLQLMQDIAEEFAIPWDYKAFEYKISNPEAPTYEHPMIGFAYSNENNKQPQSLGGRREVNDRRNVINERKLVLNNDENLNTAYPVCDLQKQQLKSEIINTENINDYQNITQMRRYENLSRSVVQNQHLQPELERDCGTYYSSANDRGHDFTGTIKKIAADELENTELHQFDKKGSLNVKTKGNQNGNYMKDWICEQNYLKRYESGHEGISSVATEMKSAASMDSKGAKAVTVIPPYSKFARDLYGSSINQDDFAHPITSEVVKGMDHNVQGSRPYRIVKSESNRAFNQKPPYVKPNVTKNPLQNYEMFKGVDGGNFHTNAPFSIRRKQMEQAATTNGDSIVEPPNVLHQSPIKQAGTLGKNSFHDDANDQLSLISPFSKPTEVSFRHMQRTFGDQPRHGSWQSNTIILEDECDREEKRMDTLLMHYSKKKDRAVMREPASQPVHDFARVPQHHVREKQYRNISAHTPSRAAASLLPETSFPGESIVRRRMRAASMQSSYVEYMHSRLPDHDDLAAQLTKMRNS